MECVPLGRAEFALLLSRARTGMEAKCACYELAWRVFRRRLQRFSRRYVCHPFQASCIVDLSGNLSVELYAVQSNIML